eukprot:Opistho-1_new@108608
MIWAARSASGRPSGWGSRSLQLRGVLYVLTWEALLVIHGTGYLETMMAAEVERKRAAGASAAELAALQAWIADFLKSYANPLIRLPITFSEIFPVGLLVSLVSAALLRNPRFMPLRREG